MDTYSKNVWILKAWPYVQKKRSPRNLVQTLEPDLYQNHFALLSGALAGPSSWYQATEGIDGQGWYHVVDAEYNLLLEIQTWGVLNRAVP